MKIRCGRGQRYRFSQRLWHEIGLFSAEVDRARILKPRYLVLQAIRVRFVADEGPSFAGFGFRATYGERDCKHGQFRREVRLK